MSGKFCLDLTKEELEIWCKENGIQSYRAGQIHKWLSSGVTDTKDMNNVPAAVRAKLEESFIFGSFKVRKTTDYINGYEDIPASNVLRFDLGNGTWFAMRPSGTEPKIKFYYYAVADTKEVSAQRVEEMKAAVDAMIGGIA